MAPSSGLWQRFLRLSSALDLVSFNSQNMHIGLNNLRDCSPARAHFTRLLAGAVSPASVYMAGAGGEMAAAGIERW
jgi:hypothetical protein